jgi:hypothetical protein
VQTVHKPRPLEPCATTCTVRGLAIRETTPYLKIPRELEAHHGSPQLLSTSERFFASFFFSILSFMTL